MNWNLMIPTDRTSVAARDFGAAAASALEAYKAEAKDLAQHVVEQIEGGIKAAEALIKTGVAGAENVYVSLSGHSTNSEREPELAWRSNAISIEVYQRPAPAVDESEAEVATEDETGRARAAKE